MSTLAQKLLDIVSPVENSVRSLGLETATSGKVGTTVFDHVKETNPPHFFYLGHGICISSI
jgi:hypothetical protein